MSTTGLSGTPEKILWGGGGRAQTAFRRLIVKKTSKQEFATDITKLFREKTEDKEKTHESKGFINAFTTPLSYRPLSINWRRPLWKFSRIIYRESSCISCPQLVWIAVDVTCLQENPGDNKDKYVAWAGGCISAEEIIVWLSFLEHCEKRIALKDSHLVYNLTGLSLHILSQHPLHSHPIFSNGSLEEPAAFGWSDVTDYRKRQVYCLFSVC